MILFHDWNEGGEDLFGIRSVGGFVVAALQH